MFGTTKKVLGVGRVLMDHVLVLPAYPANDSKTLVEEDWRQLGGPVPVALSTATRYGVATRFLGAAGTDELGDEVLAELGRRGIDVECCQRDGATGFAHVWTEAMTGRRTIAAKPGADLALPGETFPNHWTSDFEILHCDGSSIEVALACACRMKEQGGRVVLDAGSKKPGMEKLLKYVDWLIASDLFCESWFGKVAVGHGDLLSLGCPQVVRTRGSGGATYYDEHKERHFDAVAVSPVDTNGAGDVFSGSILLGLAAGWEVESMMRVANYIAGYACKFRGNTCIPTQKEIEQYLHCNQV